MPIDVNASNEVIELLSNSINRIKERLDSGLIKDVPIIVTDLNQISLLFPSNTIPNEFQFYSKILRDSFGITQPKTFGDGVRRHLLVINTEIIESLNFSDSELDAVISHELGHIFNDPEKNIENYKEKQEFYADYFAKSIGLNEPLASSIEKYLRQENSQNRDLFYLRILKLTSNENFQGSIKKL